MLRRSLLAALAGLLLSVAFEPVALPWVIPVAVAGFAWVTRGLRLRRAFVVGLAFGAAFMFTHLFWMRSVGIPAWLALSALETLFYGVLGAVSSLLQRRSSWPLFLAAAWTAMEVVRSGWPLNGMPWGRLAFAVVDSPAADALPYAGAVGVSFLLALLGTLLAWLAAGPVPGQAARPAAVVWLVGLVAVLAVPVVRPWTFEADGEVTVATVQGDVPGPGNDILYDFRQVTENHVQATVDLADDVEAGTVDRPDFVLWPENSTATDPFNDAETNAGINRASAAIGVPILVGAIVDGGPDEVLNQGIVWDPATGAGERYTKRNPVPFGEYIPMRAVFTKYQFFDRLREVGRDMLTGTRDEPLRIGDVPVADAICFDIAYDDGLVAQLRRGARLLVVQSSNATFIRTDQIDQQFAITRMRAIETGRWIAVATTNGVSGIIAPDGTVVAESEPRTTSVLVDRLGLSDQLTPAMRIGPWSGRVALLLTLLGVALALLPYRRRQDATAGEEPSGELAATTVGGP